MILHIRLDVKPVPASRPRVGKWGTYYGKTYKAFRKVMEKVLMDWDEDPVRGSLGVTIVFYCKRPKKPTKQWPRGDIDNFMKALFDSFNGKVWGDDDQVTHVVADKVYTDGEPYIDVHIGEGV